MALTEATDSNFKDTINQGVVLVDFWAPWCAPCRMVAPILEELQNEVKDKVKIVKVNVDDNPNVAMTHGITSIPTLMLFKDGQLVDRTAGAGPKDFYKNMLAKHIDLQ